MFVSGLLTHSRAYWQLSERLRFNATFPDVLMKSRGAGHYYWRRALRLGVAANTRYWPARSGGRKLRVS